MPENNEKQEPLNIFKCKWKVLKSHLDQVVVSYSIYTEETGYHPDDFRVDGTLKKKAYKYNRRIMEVKSLKLAEHICDVHNISICEDKKQWINEEIDKELKRTETYLKNRFSSITS